MNEDLLLAIFEKEGFKAKGLNFDEFKADMQNEVLQQEIFKRAGFEKKGIKFDEFVGDLGFTQKKVNTTPTLKFSPVQHALLDAIADVEAEDYNVIVGHTKENPKIFTDFSKHPNIVGVETRFGKSTAAGKLQFTKETWDDVNKVLNLPDFSPDSQNIAGLYYAEKKYKELTGGRNIYQDIDDGKLENIQQVLGGVGKATVWQGLQGDTEFPNRFKAHLGRYETILKEAEEKKTLQEKLSDATSGLKKAGADLSKVANDIVYKLDDTETVEIKGLPTDLDQLKKLLDEERKNLDFAKKDYLLKRDTEVERLKQEFQSSDTYLSIDKKYNDEYESYTKKFFDDNIKNSPEYMGVHSKLSADLNSGVLTQEEANKKLNEYINRKTSEDVGVKDFADSLGKRKSEDMDAALNGYVDADEKISSLTTQWDNIYGKSRVKQQTFLDRYNGIVDEYNKQAKQKTEEKRTSKQVGLPGGGPYAPGERPKDYSGGYVKINKTSADYEKDYEDLKTNFEKDALLSAWYQKNDRPLPESKKQKILQNFNTFNKKKEEILLKKYDALKEEIFTMDPIELGRTSIKDFNEKVNAYGDINRGYFEQDQVAGKEYVKKLIDFKAAAETKLASKYGDKYTEYVKDMDAIDILIKSGKKPSPEKIKEIQEKYSDIRNDDDWLLANREVPKLYKAAKYQFSQLADKYQQAERLREIDKQQLIADTPTLYSSPLRWIGKAFGGKVLGHSIKTAGGILEQTDKIPDELGAAVWGPAFKLINPILGEWGRKMMTSGGDMLDRNPFESRMQGQATETYALAPTGEKVVFDDEGKVKYIRNEDGTMYKGFGAEDIIKSVDGVKKEWGFNPMSFLGQALDVGAMMIPTIALSYGTAGAGLAAGVGSRAVAIMSKIGMFAGGFGEGYSSIKEEALKQSKMSYDDIDIMSTIGGFTVGITEQFNPIEGKLFNKILSKKFINENVVDLASGKIGVADYVLNIATNFVKGGVKESLFEEVPQQWSDSTLKNYYNVKNNTDFATQLSTDEWIDLFFVSIGIGGLGDAMRTGSPSYLGKEALKVITNNRELYDAYLSGMEKTDKERAAKIRADIDPMLQELDAATVELSPIRKDKAAELLFDIKSTENKLNSIKEPVLRKPYEDKLAALRKELGDTIQVKTDEKGEPIKDAEETTTTTKPKENAVQEQSVDIEAESRKKSFTDAGEQSKKDQSPKALGNFIIDNAKVGDRIRINEDEYYEVVRKKTNKKGHTETELQHFVKNEETGEFENNPAAVKLFTDKYRGTDLEKLGYRDASDLFESTYTNSKGERVTEKSIYEPAVGGEVAQGQPQPKPEGTTQQSKAQEQAQGEEVKQPTLNKEAEDLLASIGSGSKPTFVTNNLKRIAKDNGVEVTDKMSADDVINALREKQSSEPLQSTISTQVDSATTKGENVAPTQQGEAQNVNVLADFEVTTTKGTAAPRTYTKNSNGKWIAQTKKEDGTLSKGVPVSSANVVAQLNAESSKRAAESVVQTENQEVESFKTAKGSTYVVNQDGTTTRDKAARKEHPGQKGPQPKSTKTYYVTEDDLNKLSLVQATHPEEGAKFTIAELPDGNIAVGVVRESGKNNIADKTTVEPKSKPAVGLYPVEIWDGYLQPHFGNKITEVVPKQPAAQTNTTKTKDKETTKALEGVDKSFLSKIAERVKGVFYTGRGKKYEDLTKTKGDFIFFSGNKNNASWYGGDETNVSEAFIEDSEYLDLTSQDKKAKFVDENFTDDDIQKLYPQIKTKAFNDRDVRKSYEQKLKEETDKKREQLRENRFSGDNKEQKFLLQKAKDLGIKGIKLLDTFFGESDISTIAIDKSTIKNLNPQSISEAYHKAKADGSNPELVKAVEELLGKKPTYEQKVEATAKALVGKKADIERRRQAQTTKDENIESESKTSEEGKMDTPLDKEQGKGREEGGNQEKVINKAVESVIGKSMEELIKDPKAMMDYIATVELGKKDCK